jgi:hypothetical protein
MARSRADVRDWALAYIDAQESSQRVDIDHPLWWSIGRTQRLTTSDDVEDIWAFILEVLSRSKSERVVGMVSAGPMEDLIHYWGEHFIERIEATARCNPDFRKMLRGVWESGTPDIWRRILAVREEGGENGP